MRPACTWQRWQYRHPRHLPRPEDDWDPSEAAWIGDKLFHIPTKPHPPISIAAVRLQAHEVLVRGERHPGQPLSPADDRFIRSLLLYHPKALTKELQYLHNLRVEAGPHPYAYTWCFWGEYRHTGALTDVSYVKCCMLKETRLTRLLRYADVLLAGHAIETRDRLWAAREEAPIACSISGRSITRQSDLLLTLEDHTVETLVMLWLVESGVTNADIKAPAPRARRLPLTKRVDADSRLPLRADLAWLLDGFLRRTARLEPVHAKTSQEVEDPSLCTTPIYYGATATRHSEWHAHVPHPEPDGGGPVDPKSQGGPGASAGAGVAGAAAPAGDDFEYPAYESGEVAAASAQEDGAGEGEGEGLGPSSPPQTRTQSAARKPAPSFAELRRAAGRPAKLGHVNPREVQAADKSSLDQLDPSSLELMKLEDLKAVCMALDVAVHGRKSEVIARIRGAFPPKAPQPNAAGSE